MKYAIFVLSLFFATSSGAQGVTNSKTTHRVSFRTASVSVMVEGKGVPRVLDASTTYVDCTITPDRCNEEIDDNTEGEPSEPNDPSGPEEGGEEEGGEEPAEYSSGEDGPRRTDSSNNFNLPQEIMIESWTEGDAKHPNRYCVWVKRDGKWALSKRPKRVISNLKKYILATSS